MTRVNKQSRALGQFLEMVIQILLLMNNVVPPGDSDSLVNITSVLYHSWKLEIACYVDYKSIL